MNKKGFTLIEIIAVLAILAILSLFVTPSIIRFRKNMVEKTYESRVNMINSAALEWANDNLIDVHSHVSSNYDNQTTRDDVNCLYVKIKDLINNGYLSGSDDNRTVMKNPINNTNMNEKEVCIRYNTNNVLNRKLISYIVE